jgi:hypothetical protein
METIDRETVNLRLALLDTRLALGLARRQRDREAADANWLEDQLERVRATLGAARRRIGELEPTLAAAQVVLLGMAERHADDGFGACSHCRGPAGERVMFPCVDYSEATDWVQR